jgi:hypothetical protein
MQGRREKFLFLMVQGEAVVDGQCACAFFCVFSLLEIGRVVERILIGSFLLGLVSWGGSLRRSSRHADWGLQGMRVSFSTCLRLSHLTDQTRSIVEFASQEDAQRAVRELSELSLLGRPVFIREVRTPTPLC